MIRRAGKSVDLGGRKGAHSRLSDRDQQGDKKSGTRVKPRMGSQREGCRSLDQGNFSM